MEKQNHLADAVAYQFLEQGFDLLIAWLDAHPERDVTEFTDWREAERVNNNETHSRKV